MTAAGQSWDPRWGEQVSSRSVEVPVKTSEDLAWDDGYSQGFFEGRRSGIYEALDEVKSHVTRVIDRD